MKWKTKVIFPAGRATGLTLILFVALLALCAIVAAHAIWVLDKHDPKWGDQWGNFQFTIMIYSMILGVQCGIILLGNLVSALLTGKAFTRITVIAGVSFVLADGAMLVAKVDPTNGWLLFAIPGTFATLTAILTMMKKWRHPTST